jgi:hypothetical protein
MNTLLKAKLEEAIASTILNNCEENLWDGLIHDTLVKQMTTAAEQVFDATMDSQTFVRFGYRPVSM